MRAGWPELDGVAQGQSDSVSEFGRQRMHCGKRRSGQGKTTPMCSIHGASDRFLQPGSSPFLPHLRRCHRSPSPPPLTSCNSSRCPIPQRGPSQSSTRRAAETMRQRLGAAALSCLVLIAAADPPSSKVRKHRESLPWAMVKARQCMPRTESLRPFGIEEEDWESYIFSYFSY
jgi:hypothetical protein